MHKDRPDDKTEAETNANTENGKRWKRHSLRLLASPCLPRHIDGHGQQQAFVDVKRTQPFVFVLRMANFHLETRRVHPELTPLVVICG